MGQLIRQVALLNPFPLIVRTAFFLAVLLFRKIFKVKFKRNNRFFIDFLYVIDRLEIASLLQKTVKAGALWA